MAHLLGTLGSERVVVPAVPGRQESEQQLAKITNIWICNYTLLYLYFKSIDANGRLVFFLCVARTKHDVRKAL